MAVRQLLVIQASLLHPHLGQQVPGLPTYIVVTPSTHSHLAECSQDCFLRGQVFILHDQAEDQHQEASLGQALPTAQHHIAGEAQGRDHDVDMLPGVQHLYLQANHL